MLVVAITWAIILWGAASCTYMLWHGWRRFPRRDFDDVVHFLYPVDLQLAESLLDPAAEFEFSWKLTPQEFRQAQCRRMSVYLELVRRMAHNSRVLVEFSGEEVARNDPRNTAQARLLQQKAIEVRIYALLTLLKVRLWMWIFPAALGSVPAIPQLRRTGDVDGIRTYCALKGAATATFSHLEAAQLDVLTRSL
jgi:hypothetical protein